MSALQNDTFLRACRREPVERTPVWIMRQAGRYLAEYRAVRDTIDFLTLCKTPELAAEVTLQPVDIIGVDAAIIFSDILVIPEAMGMHLTIEEGAGPVFEKPLRDEHDVHALRDADPDRNLKYVLDAIFLAKQELNGRVPLIGFSGSPWTLLTYMVEGEGSQHFFNAKRLIYRNPALAHRLLGRLTDAVTRYLSAQIDAGAQAVQIFDSWGGILSPGDFVEFSLQYMQEIIENLTRNDEPVIIFSKGVHGNLTGLAGSGAEVVGLDWTFDIGEVREKIGHKTALQGNLDPSVLLADAHTIRSETKRILDSFGHGEGHVFNLGHGILKETDPENARVLVQCVKEESVRYHPPLRGE